MTKGELIELVLLRVSGGKLSPDITVRREDIEIMFSAAYNLVVSQDQSEKHNIKEFRLLGPQFALLSTFQSTLITPTPGDPYYYMEPPGANDTGDWVARVAPKTGQEFIRVRTASDVQSISFPVPVFWTEGKRIYIYNQMSDCQLRVTYHIDPRHFDDDDEIPFPDGGDAKVIEYLCEYFEKQRMNPTDYRTNDHDVKQQF